MGEVRDEIRMVDVGEKPETRRAAVAKGFVRLSPSTLREIREGRIEKGNVFAAAELAGIMAAKRAHELIPLCHPLRLTKVEVGFEMKEEGVEITAKAEAVERTGVEMEALLAVSAAALTIYDMCKGIEPTIRITDIRLVMKSGGKSGTKIFE